MYRPSVYEIRASALGGAFECALMFEKEQFEGFRSPNSPRALIGTGTHVGTASFDLGKLQGHPLSYDDAASVTVDAIAERIALEGVAWRSDEPSRAAVEATAVRLTRTYCADISARYTFESVELTTKPRDVDCGGGVLIRLKGTLDRARSIRVIDADGRRRRRVGDLKTGQAIVSAAGVIKVAKHSAQVGIYQFLDEHTSGVPGDDTAEIIGLNTTGKFHTGHGYLHGAKQRLLGTDGRTGLLDMAAHMFRTGLFPPNPRSVLCSAKFCGYHHRCPYAHR